MARWPTCPRSTRRVSSSARARQAGNFPFGIQTAAAEPLTPEEPVWPRPETAQPSRTGAPTRAAPQAATESVTTSIAGHREEVGVPEHAVEIEWVRDSFGARGGSESVSVQRVSRARPEALPSTGIPQLDRHRKSPQQIIVTGAAFLLGSCALFMIGTEVEGGGCLIGLAVIGTFVGLGLLAGGIGLRGGRARGRIQQGADLH